MCEDLKDLTVYFVEQDNGKCEAMIGGVQEFTLKVYDFINDYKIINNCTLRVYDLDKSFIKKCDMSFSEFYKLVKSGYMICKDDDFFTDTIDVKHIMEITPNEDIFISEMMNKDNQVDRAVINFLEREAGRYKGGREEFLELIMGHAANLLNCNIEI